LFFGEQQDKNIAARISVNINEIQNANELTLLRVKHAVLLYQLMKYRESADLYYKAEKQYQRGV
jgi:hypothetical protein